MIYTILLKMQNIQMKILKIPKTVNHVFPDIKLINYNFFSNFKILLIVILLIILGCFL